VQHVYEEDDACAEVRQGELEMLIAEPGLAVL
jgi:hypothetical protein